MGSGWSFEAMAGGGAYLLMAVPPCSAHPVAPSPPTKLPSQQRAVDRAGQPPKLMTVESRALLVPALADELALVLVVVQAEA